MLSFNAESFVIAILVFSLFFLFLSSGRTAKSFLENVLSTVIKRVCDQDLTHSLDTSRYVLVKIVPEVVIHDVYGT